MGGGECLGDGLGISIGLYGFYRVSKRFLEGF